MMLVPGLVIIVSIIVVVVIIVVVFFLMRSNKKKGMAAGSGGEWQRQVQPGAWNPQGGAWGQQGQGQWGGAPNPAAQAGNWGSGPQNPWGASAQQQSANPWGAPAQQQSTSPWGAPAQQQSANPWEPAPTSQDPWGQQQAAASQQQQAWGMSPAASAPVQQGNPTPAAFGANSSSAAAGWSQTPQANPAAASPVAQSPGFQATGAPSSLSGWQQGGVGNPGAGFVGNEVDKTVLRSTAGSQQNGAIGYVQVKEGKEPGKIYEIRKESLSIGRSRESDIFLEDLAVSRLHASIVNMGNGSYSLKDEGSANGTKVNDQLVDKFKTYPLQEGDQIQLGQTVLVFARH